MIDLQELVCKIPAVSTGVTTLRTIMALAALLSSGTFALSQQAPNVFEPKPVLKAEKAVGADIAGLIAGMTQAEIAQVLSDRLPGAQQQAARRFFQISSKGVSVRTTEAIYSLSAEKITPDGREELAAYFSGEAAGSQAVRLFRSLSYNDVLKSPDVEAVKQALTIKYGPPTDVRANQYPNLLSWTLADGKRVPCQSMIYRTPDYCHVPTGIYEPQYLQSISEDYKKVKPDTYIRVELTTHPQDRSKLQSVTVSLNDFKKMGRSAEADRAAILGELNRAHSQISASVEAPKF